MFYKLTFYTLKTIRYTNRNFNFLLGIHLVRKSRACIIIVDNNNVFRSCTKVTKPFEVPKLVILMA